MVPVVTPISLDSTRDVQREWAALSVEDRLGIVRRLRHALALRARAFAQTVGRAVADTLTSEVLPLAEACRFLERNAARLLAPQRPGRRGRPSWLPGVDLEIHREPLGTVLIIGPSNYPLFLPAVQAVQALTAGNAVIVKPGLGGWAAMSFLSSCLEAAGLAPCLFRVLSEDPSDAMAAIEAGVDKVILTGSNETGRAVLPALAKRLVPSTMELSGYDAVFVLPGADLRLLVRALRFGMELNGGNTCIAPRQVIAVGDIHAEVMHAIDFKLPLLSASSAEEAWRLAAADGYALGASVFGPEQAAREFARGIRAGVVVINDMIVPTADPRLPFGGRGESGFGVTRGAEGLLDLTVPKAITVRRGRWLPHLGPKHAADAELFASFIAWSHAGSLGERLAALKSLVRAGMARRK